MRIITIYGHLKRPFLDGHQLSQDMVEEVCLKVLGHIWMEYDAYQEY